MRTWMIVVFAAVAAVAGCKKKCPDCPKADCPQVDAGVPAADAPYEFVYVKDEKTGNQAMVATTPDKKIIVVPLDPAKTRVYLNGQTTTLGEAVTFSRGPGGCPCQIPACLPYCRPAAEVLGLSPDEFYGTSGGTTPTEPTPPVAPQ